MAWTEKYVTVAGGGAHDGSSEANAYTFAEMVAALAAGNRYNVKAGTAYDLSGGAVTFAATGPYIVQGYTTTIGDAASDPTKRAVLDNGTATTDMLTVSGAQSVLRDLILVSSATSGTGDGLRVTGASSIVERVKSYGWYNNGIEMAAAYSNAISCETYDCNKAGTAWKAGFVVAAGAVNFFECIAHDINAGDTDGHGFVSAGNLFPANFVRCVADTCGGYGFLHAGRSTNCIFYHCDAYNCGAGGFSADIASYIPCAVALRCNSIDNGTSQFKSGQTTNLFLIEGCFSKGTRTSDGGLMLDESSSSTFASVPYTDGPNGNFVLDPTNGSSGRSVAVAMPTTQGYTGSTTAYVDTGAARHIDPTLPAVGNVRVGTVYGNSSGSTGTLVVGGWTDGSGALTLAKNTTDARGGSGTCAKLTPNTNSTYGYWYVYVPCTATTATTISFYSKKDSGFDGNFKVSVYDSDGDILNTSQDFTSSLDTTYAQMTCTEIASPTGTGFLLVRFEVSKNSGDTTESVYVDDISYT